MATLHRQNGRQIVQWTDPLNPSRRKTLSLGTIAEREARRIQTKIETMQTELAILGELSQESRQWVERQTVKLRGKLETVGLAMKAKPAITIGELLEAFFEWKTGKEATIESYEKVRRNLFAVYGRDRIADSITDIDADALRQHMLEKLAPATVNRRVISARTIWAYGVRFGLVKRNPFLSVKGGSQENESRKFYVDPNLVRRIIDLSPDNELKLIIAMARFAGLRTPSEILELKWADIDWAAGAFTVRSSKLEHHKGGGTRIVPIFADVFPLLETLYGQADDKSGHVIVARRDVSGTAWRKQLGRLIVKAGASRWPKPFHNMRASCITDLLQAGVAITAVATWMGNSALVAHKFYAMITPEQMRAAKTLRTGGVSVGQNRSASPIFSTANAESRFSMGDEGPEPQLENLALFTKRCKSIVAANRRPSVRRASLRIRRAIALGLARQRKGAR